MSESKWKQFQKSKYFTWLIAKNKTERKYFWIRFIMFSIIIIVLAHFPLTGWTIEKTIVIPEIQAWDLNPIMWPPYYLTGNTHVRNYNYDPIIPPLQHMLLYFISLVYWLFIAFLISKLWTRNKFKNELLETNKGDTAG